ncbi:MAG TPA: peptidase S8, partial [Thermoanaerobaculia bacterium]|nr:peptidase S8 [Thermoanaerobaculia bacterium]
MPDASPARIQPPPKRPPPFRNLRVYAFDPSLNWQIDTAVINQMTLQVPWEDLMPGPVGEYLEVVDVDPASGCCYAPVDLEDRFLLAQGGLDPAEGDPQFHQQMVYAVAMTTIRNFERALGRRVLWSPADEEQKYQFVRRLRVYPHALREANAYYSPHKKALLFGYFPAAAEGRNLPGGTVFTCLSHDVVAHETTHALLDGLHRRFVEPTNVDSQAFHEGFADVVALFQHFSFPAALRDQIRRTRGDLASQNLLGQLAQQFGEAIGQYGALRDALGEVDKETKKWRPKEPNPAELATTREPHARGAILVAAVFDAFLSIYKSRIADLLRIASSGTGVLPEGDLHPDLVDRLAREASATAAHVLNMCIRALDYCPPVDVGFGDYLRALVTADRDLVPDDDRGYRIAVVEAFRRRGIYPQGVRSLSTESLCWSGPLDADVDELRKLLPGVEDLRRLPPDWSGSCDRQKIQQNM